MSGQVNPNPNSTRPPKPARRTKKLPLNLQITRVRHPQSSRSGIVVFLGEENSGISTTLNFLFGDHITPVDGEGGKTEICEFQSSFPVENLRLIDVPGLGKSSTPSSSSSSALQNNSSSERDSQILATVKKYFDRDPELSRCIPHVVILCTKFDHSSSFGHPSSKLVKTLKAINLLKARLFDEHNCNLIVILTHFMYTNRTTRANPTFHINKVTQLVQFYLNLPQDPFVVLAENEAYAWNLPEIPGTNYFQLPSGEMYPDNLIRAIYSIVKNSKSLIGLDFFKFVLEQRFSVRFQPRIVYPMVDYQRKRFAKMLQVVDTVYSSSSI